ncbi:MAG: class SAM-dependent methyltransferase, partial [Myxococcales bacterium]|nr:class SAM-dependent methyltransferase [Myxococcales bacterium]
SPYLGDFLRKVEFDTIYHEHLCYYSLTALTHLFRRHELVIEDCEPLPIHGGSLRIYARHEKAARQTDRVRALLDEEQRQGIDSDEPYAHFAAGVERIVADLTGLVRRLREDGKRLCAYGAAAKGTVLLNACGLGPRDLEFVCDKNPLKQGRVMPGVHVPIVAPSELSARAVDYCLLLAWNVADEVRREQAEWEAAGGKFILPVPTVQVLP